MLGDGVTFTNDNNFTSGTYQPALNASSAGNGSMPAGLRNINVYGQVDIARSSSERPASLAVGDVSETVGTIARIPFARDAFGLAFTDSLATKVCNAGQNSAVAPACVPYLTNSQLRSIFTTNVVGGPTVNVGPAGSTTPIQIQGVVPQEGSGTRSDFVSKIGTDSNTVKAATAVKVAQEHDATGLIGDEVTPMSVSRWIAMKNKVSFNRSASAVLGAITTSETAAPALPTTGTAPALAPNKPYYDDLTWGRDTYLFVERARITKPAVGQPKGKYDENLHALVDPSVQGDGFVLNNLVNREIDSNSKVGKVKLMFGLLPATDVNIKFTVPKYSGTW
jgi:ABC-type phosphate transport system substrate-binding protein